jgi:3-hydroxyethyl bacteriochlorophyllide a dehydrogenase
MSHVAAHTCRAIAFLSPRVLAVQRLQLADMGPADVELEVAYSGISTGTERLLWDGTMPPSRPVLPAGTRL